jgi:N-acyl-D-aspartate/D-glutamate deacylase
MPTMSKTGSAIISKITKATSCIKNIDFTGAMTEFITNISNIQLDTIPDFIPCDKKLHLTRPKMREEMRNNLKRQMPQFFKKRGYENYDEINGCSIDKFEETIEAAVNILVKKQQGSEKIAIGVDVIITPTEKKNEK